jgi:hypothetical protein
VERLSQRRAQFDADERRRRKMAERLALELATASHREGSDYVASRMVQVDYSSAVEVDMALSEAPTVIFMGRHGADVGTFTGRGGTVMYVHMPDLWSLVFPLEPFTGLILVGCGSLTGRSTVGFVPVWQGMVAGFLGPGRQAGRGRACARLVDRHVAPCM